MKLAAPKLKLVFGEELNESSLAERSLSTMTLAKLRVKLSSSFWRREEAKQQKITDWLKWSAQREEDRRQERAQLLAMRRKKEESTLDPSLLSPVYGIDFTPSAAA